MESAYDLHQHTHCVIIHIGKEETTTCILSTSNRNFSSLGLGEVKLDTSISYNKQRTVVSGFGRDNERRGKDKIVINNFHDGLYDLFRKDKEAWNEENRFFMKAFSDYLPLAIKETMKQMELEIENFDLFHYAFVIPSEWEEEIRDDMIRPIFVQSGLISNQDHQDRLLFFTDIEAILNCYSFKRGENTILYRLTLDKKKVIINSCLIQYANTPNTQLFPRAIKSSLVSVAFGEVTGHIRDFLTENLSSVNDDVIEAIIKGINSPRFPSLEEEPWIIFKEDWMLSEIQKEFINSLCPSTICAEIGTSLRQYMKHIISNKFTKSFKSLLIMDDYNDSDDKFENEIKWLEYILDYNSRFLIYTDPIFTFDFEAEIIEPKFILEGAGIGVIKAIKYLDMSCKPRIVSSANLTTSSTVFLHSKPDAIINLDISLGSTLFTCSILDEDGLTQQIFDHGYFIKDKHLPPLGHFYTFSNTTTLNIKEQFIPFAERYLLGDLSYFFVGSGVSMKKDLLLEMKAILTNDLSYRGVLVSTDEQKYIKAFTLMYMIYIKEEILYKLPDQLVSDQMDMKIGYAVSIEAMLLNSTIESKDNLRDVIYASGLVPKDDNSKKLRITTQGERILPAIQKSLKLELSLKSYFLLCQLHEDYVQLSLHQVVTEPNSEEKEQESIIVQDEILAIQNVYDSLCSHMGHHLLQDSSLIELCEMHNTSDNSKILNLFSSEIMTEFFANLKGHISDNILQNNPGMQSINAVNLTSSCNCKVRLTTSDIIDISFTPVLQDIARTLSASLLNKELFGNYINLDYLFSIIRFNNNPQLQHTFATLLEKGADNLNLELEIGTSILAVPELFSQLLQPVIAQRPFCYKDFKTGALQQVWSENYVASITEFRHRKEHPFYKSKTADTKTIECGDDIVFPFLNKGEITNSVRSNRTFYLQNKKDYILDNFSIGIYQFKTINYLNNNETLSLSDNFFRRTQSVSKVFPFLFKSQDVDVPVTVSVSYVSHTSTLQFFVKTVCADTKDEKLMGVIEIGESLTLTRF